MRLTPEQAQQLLDEYGSIAELARRLNRNERSLRRWLKRHLPEAYAREPAQELTIGVISDTHLASRYASIEALNRFYDLCQQRNITTVLHCGDFLDGLNVYRGHLAELALPASLDAHITYAVENYPRREGIKTLVLAGNHDTSYIKTGGLNPLPIIAQQRDDIEHLGDLYATIKLAGVRIGLAHPEAGLTQAISYRAQKFVDAMPPQERPDILLTGHYHTTGYFVYQGVHIILCGTTQHQTPYLRRKGLRPAISACILTITTRGGKVERFMPEFITLEAE
ncbi:metallophosphoesterase family protein [Desulfofundulus kuznetsovii]|uniref:metallophosphoesterase family protein n=1 Tax=Desulfofundulus kuznetsovii TaxID=58135 RepID=UPI0002FA6D29